MKTYTELEVKKILEIAFRKGELWGVTYQGWFTPTNKDWIEEFEKVIKLIFDDERQLDEKLIETWS